jgi:hypothetical protein
LGRRGELDADTERRSRSYQMGLEHYARKDWAEAMQCFVEAGAKDLTRDRETMHLAAKLRWDHWRHVGQTESETIPVLATERLRRASGFAGAMARADVERRAFGIRWQPRLKVEAVRQRPAALEDPFQYVTSEIRSAAYLLGTISVLRNTEIQLGIERLRLWQLHDAAKGLRQTGSRYETARLIQVRNCTEYLGYEVFTEMGVRSYSVDLDRFDRPTQEAVIFLTMYAGFGS